VFHGGMTLDAFDLNPLAFAIETELRGALSQLREKTAGEHLYAVVVGLVEDLSGFFVAGQTLEEADAAEGDEAARAYLWWSPEEWPLTFDDPTDTDLGRVTSALWALADTASGGREVDDATYAALRGAYEERIVRALERLRDEGELRTESGEPLWAWLHYVDEFDEAIDDRTFARIQGNPALTEKFALRFGTRADSLTAVLAERIAALG
jgi:hypothetical protein